MRLKLYVLSLVVVAVFIGCATPHFELNRARARARIIRQPLGGWAPVAAGTNADVVLAQALDHVHGLAVHLGRLEAEARSLREGLGARRRGYFTVDETDRIEGLLFRYLACRESLWDMVAYYGSREREFGDAGQQTKAFLVALHAATLLSHYSAKLVLAYLDDEALVRKLNEGHFVYDIPPRSYDEIFESVTARENIRALRDAWAYTSKERKDPQSMLARLLAEDPAYGDLMRETDAQYASASRALKAILEKRSIVDPEASNIIRHSRLVRNARRAKRDIGENLFVAKGLLYGRIGDIKRSGVAPAAFTEGQAAQIKGLLQPGDMIFTYTAGYMSNVFLPGTCKHGIVYVGSPAERRAAGVSEDLLVAATEAKRQQLSRCLDTAQLPSGYPADVVEAVSEGVVFNSLDYLLKNHVTRMVVLRPRVSASDRAGALLATFLMVGGQYDFNFDFADVSYLCCTEVVYRSLQKRGAIDFPLVPRFGVQTLCADDILLYHLRQQQPKFDLILLAEEVPNSRKHLARVDTGADAAARLNAWFADKLATARAP